MRGLLAYDLEKERQEDTHPSPGPVPCSVQVLFSGLSLCPYCSLSFLHSLPLSLQVSHLWEAWKGGFG